MGAGLTAIKKARRRESCSSVSVNSINLTATETQPRVDYCDDCINDHRQQKLNQYITVGRGRECIPSLQRKLKITQSIAR